MKNQTYPRIKNTARKVVYAFQCSRLKQQRPRKSSSKIAWPGWPGRHPSGIGSCSVRAARACPQAQCGAARLLAAQAGAAPAPGATGPAVDPRPAGWTAAGRTSSGMRWALRGQRRHLGSLPQSAFFRKIWENRLGSAGQECHGGPPGLPCMCPAHLAQNDPNWGVGLDGEAQRLQGAEGRVHLTFRHTLVERACREVARSSERPGGLGSHLTLHNAPTGPCNAHLSASSRLGFVGTAEWPSAPPGGPLSPTEGSGGQTKDCSRWHESWGMPMPSPMPCHTHIEGQHLDRRVEELVLWVLDVPTAEEEAAHGRQAVSCCQACSSAQGLWERQVGPQRLGRGWASSWDNGNRHRRAPRGLPDAMLTVFHCEPHFSVRNLGSQGRTPGPDASAEPVPLATLPFPRRPAAA